jgi:sulfotransferase
MKKLYFLGGIPRSGSTLLGSLLNQHPDIYVSPTSPLGDIIFDIEKTIKKVDIQFTFDKERISYNIYSSILDNYYNHIEKPYILDKNRFWGKNLDTVQKFISYKPKIILTYRPIPEVITSYISLIKRTNYQNNFIDNHIKKDNLPITIDNRVDYIWRHYISPSYEAMIQCFYNHQDISYFVNYNDLIKNPQQEIDKIYKFLEVSSFENDFFNIENKCSEKKDEEWGLKDLHTIRPRISKISENPIDVIGEENVKIYSKFNI